MELVGMVICGAIAAVLFGIIAIVFMGEVND
jgi:hypothetical protein